MDDQRIIRLYHKREETAIEQTDIKYGHAIFNFANRILNNAQDAWECLNDTYLKAWNSMPPVWPRALQAYLLRLCRCTACNRLNWNNAKKRGAVMVELTLELEQCIPAAGAGKETEQIVIKDVLNLFLEQLPKESRILFLQRYWFAREIAEIAKENGMSQGKVKMNLMRSRKKLRAMLEKEGLTV